MDSNQKGVLGPRCLRTAQEAVQLRGLSVHCAMHDFTAHRVQDGPPEAASRFRSGARCCTAGCGACSRTQVRSARSSPPAHHRAPCRNRSAASDLGLWGPQSLAAGALGQERKSLRLSSLIGRTMSAEFLGTGSLCRVGRPGERAFVSATLFMSSKVRSRSKKAAVRVSTSLTRSVRSKAIEASRALPLGQTLFGTARRFVCRVP